MAGTKRWEVLHGDCLDVMRSMADASVDAVVSDPPYGVKYDHWDGAVPPPAILAECLRVSRGAVMWFGAAQVQRMFDFAGYDPQPDRMLVWAPSFSLAATSKSRIFFRFHPIWCWRMPKAQEAIDSDVLRDPCEGRHWWDHPATKPVDLMRKLVAAVVPPGGTVLDPYAGSGSTLVAAILEGARPVGVEREAQYVEIARRRCDDATRQGNLFASTES